MRWGIGGGGLGGEMGRSKLPVENAGEALVWEGGITVWLYEDGDPTKIAFECTVTAANGTVLECGHQRPPAPTGSDRAS